MTYKERNQDFLIDAIIEHLRYCEETGNIYRKKNSRMGPKLNFLQPAGFVMNSGYRALKVCGHRVMCHRAAFVLMNGRFPEFEIDHINGDKLDNRWVNLRECTKAQNAQNRAKLCTRRAWSKHMGVSYSKKRSNWFASIDVNKKRIYLGSFETEEEAAKAYADAKAIYHTFNPVLDR